MDVEDTDDDKEQLVDFFSEASVIEEILAGQAVYNDEIAPVQICAILEKYQEQPELLDPHLEKMIGSLFAIVLNELLCSKYASESYNSSSQGTSNEEEMKGGRHGDRSGSTSDAKEKAPVGEIAMHRVFHVIYVLCKVRGYKTVTKFFPHEVKHLEPALAMLVAQGMSDHEHWHTRYSLLLWMSVLVLIPFDLSTVDSADRKLTARGLTDRLIELCKVYLGDTGAPREAAAVLLGKLFSRPDMHANKLSQFFSWVKEVLHKKDVVHSHVFLVTGCMKAMAEIINSAPREAVQSRISVLWDTLVQEQPWLSFKSALCRKLHTKLIQRIGLAFLKPKLAPWRYQRGHRSLLSNLQNQGNDTDATSTGGSSSSGGGAGAAKGNAAGEDEEDEEDIPAEVEEVIQSLLEGLKDKETIVRWSAAKGIGRVTMRLPMELADQVYQNIHIYMGDI